jgi:RNA polymerase sigma-70 factor (ECF subfamily)
MSLENKTRSRPQNSNSTSTGKDKLVLDEIVNSNKDADSDVIKDRNLRILNKALCKLSPKDQKVLTLKYIHQLTYKEIGEITQSTVNAVGVRLSRALKRLHRILEEKDLIKKLDIEKNIK